MSRNGASRMKFQSGKQRGSSSTKRLLNELAQTDHSTPIPRAVSAKPLRAQTQAQGHYLLAIDASVITIATGPAGTGKTFLAGAYAAEQLISGKCDRVIITRPAIEVGQSLGLLPGELHEKYAPFLTPFREVMIERMGKGHYEYAVKMERVSAQPLSYMRGATFRDAVVVLDEAQNCTPAEMKMFLTRIGENCKVIINGDIEQCDLRGPCGLEDAVHRISHLDDVTHIRFTEDDIVRSGIVREILRAYRK